MVYDVVIVGGGLAGLSLARQLACEMRQLQVGLIHNGRFPNDQVTHTVGESTVEMGGFYLRETLDLKRYLEEVHIRKMGLRFIQNEENAYKEMGLSTFPYHDAYQLDRGLLENHLHTLIQDKVDVYEEHRFLDFHEEDGLKRVRAVTAEGVEKTFSCRWLIDASGRKRCLARKFNLSKPMPLTHSAVWFRVDGVVDLNRLYVSDDPENDFYGAERHHSTVHIVGKGYWVWLIPLAGGKTSIGIVFDETVWEANALISREKAFAWLSQQERALFEFLSREGFPVLDFRFYRKYSYGAEGFISKQGWALTGEAKGFVDPLYSNGTDFIAIANTMICAVIKAEQRGEDVEPYRALYNELLDRMYDVFCQCHLGAYNYFDDWYYVYVKTNIDALFYFGSYCVLFMNRKMEDLPFMREASTIVQAMIAVYKETLSFVNSEAFRQVSVGVKRYINLAGSIEDQVNKNIIVSSDDPEEILSRLRENYLLLEDVRQRLKAGEDFEKIFYPPRQEIPMAELLKMMENKRSAVLQ